ncbi:MAG: nuclear transport factor 2 family protein [Sphingomonadaceae bacterium]|nr:nuclear transport factor 2 family protein [Sphingomonadaceae bacterium]
MPRQGDRHLQGQGRHHAHNRSGNRDHGDDRRGRLRPSHRQLTSPTTAIGECYGIAVGLRREDGEPYRGNMYGGRYLDEYEKREGAWRISSRRYVMDWVQPMADQPDASPRADFPLPMLDLTESGHPDYRPM